jgi:hypothetical protein
MPAVSRRELIVTAMLAVAGCKRNVAPAPVAATQPTPQTKPAFAGASSPEELKRIFLERFNNDDVDGVMELFYLKGASQQMIDLYRTAAAKDPGTTAASVEITDLPADDHESSVHTLKREKKLLLKFNAAGQSSELRSVEQFFYIGRHDGKYFLTLPTGQ